MAFTESVNLEKNSKITKFNLRLNATIPTRLHCEMSCLYSFFKSSRDSDSTISLGSPFQCLTIPSVKTFFILSNPRLPCKHKAVSPCAVTSCLGKGLIPLLLPCFPWECGDYPEIGSMCFHQLLWDSSR